MDIKYAVVLFFLWKLNIFYTKGICHLLETDNNITPIKLNKCSLMTSLIMLLLLEADNVKSGVCLWFREKLLCRFNAHLLYKHFIGNTRSMLFRAPVCCQTAWRLFWCGFHWMLKTFLWDNNPCWHYCTARFFAAHQYINMEGDFAGFCDVMGKPLKSTALIVMLLKPVRQNQADIINLKVVIKRW